MIRPLALFSLLLSVCPAQDGPDDKVAQLFARFDRKGWPGCAVAVIQDGKSLFRAGFGRANIELDVPIRPDSVFYTGSVSKQFVAMCILLLEQEGKLSLDDDIRDYVVEIPSYGDVITIRHMLEHTSGLRDYLALLGLRGRDFGAVRDDQEIVDLLAQQRGLNFRPGQRYSYSNSGYFLAAVIVRRVSDRSIREYAREKIFEPLGMKRTRFHDDYAEPIPGRASGYHVEGAMVRNFISKFDRVGSGGVFSSVDDLARWDANYYSKTVGGDAVHTRMHTRGKLNDGTEHGYGLGVAIGEYRGLRTVSHGGALGGYRSFLLRFPDERFTVVILANRDAIDTGGLARQVAEIYLADQLDSTAATRPERATQPAREPFRIAVDALPEYAGRFHSDEVDAEVSIAARGRMLVLRDASGRTAPLRAIARDRFRSASLEIEFRRDAGGGVESLTLVMPRASGIVFTRR